MVNIKGNVVAIDETGTIVKVYTNMKEASNIIGVNICTLYYRFYHLIPTNGLLYIQKSAYDDVMKNNLRDIFYSRRVINKIKESKSYKKKVNHVIKYDTRHKLVCITPCPFSESDDRPRVGSARCFYCRSFVEKNSETKEVFCAFNQFGIKNICSKKK